MKLEERLKYFKDKGYTYNPETGIVKSDKGSVTKSTSYGYLRVRTRIGGNKIINISNHQFAWYIYYGEVPTLIDHKDRDKLNNKIENLRLSTNQKNSFNRNVKGYWYDKKWNKYEVTIMLNNKRIKLGRFDTPEEAHQAYLDAKKIYHKE